ncbi:hypothetical protein KL918_002179 [Ogataea parapolymorpha]|nr:hypothetical protein KL918_002179 [Ogataea parapolymorpha]KAG7871708.1 hypothetical protein KL916_003808 [Ogataea parapolymorpha]
MVMTKLRPVIACNSEDDRKCCFWSQLRPKVGGKRRVMAADHIVDHLCEHVATDIDSILSVHTLAPD